MVDYVGGAEDNTYIVTLADGTSHVDGGAGTDSLTIDWSTAPVGSYNFWHALTDEAVFQVGQKSVYFRNIENLTFLSGRSDDTFGLLFDIAVRYDGGAGRDAFYALFGTSSADISFALNSAPGSISTFVGQGTQISNVEYLNIETGSGDDMLVGGNLADRLAAGTGHNIVNGAGGYDTIITTGIDTVDGGSESDDWQVDYTGTTQGVAYGYTGINQYSLSNGTSAISVEQVSLMAGSGDDTFLMGDAASVTIDGGAGLDSLSVDWSARNGPLTIYHYSNGAVSGSYLSASSIERFTLTLSAFDDRFIFGGYGITTADGGDGIDLAYIVVTETTANLSFTLNMAPGSVSTIIGQGSTFTHFERVEFEGGYGNDTLTGGIYADTLNGGAGNDLIEGGLGDDVLTGGAGIDTINYANAANGVTVSLWDFYADGAGHDSIEGFENIRGSAFDDILIGDNENNVLSGLRGADVMRGLYGDDAYFVDNIGDVVIEEASWGLDSVNATVSYTLSDNVETLILLGSGHIDGTGNEQANSITGNAGDNSIDGRGGADRMEGKAGNDIYYVDNVGDIVVEASGAGTDIIYSSVSYSLVTRFVETLHLTGDGSINATGNSQANTLIGNSGNNILRGMGGTDLLTGGAGRDHFLFDTAIGRGNIDTITDFSVRDDTIRLSRSIFTAIGANGTLDADAFRIGSFATDAQDRIIYHSATGRLFYDADGNGAGEAQMFAYVTPGLAMTSADFWVVA